MIFAFIYRSLILAFGYAYPAFLCFKTVEKNKIEIKELRFWCQYWIIVAILTIVEIFSDIFISWLPMYGEMKLAIVIYLWHPGTKGAGYVYETFLRPYMSRREREIDSRIMELKERVFSFVIHYWSCCSALMGLNRIVPIVHMLISQSAKILMPNSQKAENQQSNGAPPPTPPSTPSKVYRKMNSEKGRPPAPLQGNAAAAHLSQTTRSQSVKVKLHNQAQFIHTQGSEEKSNSIHEFHGIKLRSVKSQLSK